MAPRRKESNSDTGSPRKTSPVVSATDTFPCKAFQVIQHCEKNDPDVASWSADGSYFVVKDTAVFSSSHLPRYFRHSNFQSFNRQLNIYGFRTVKEHDNSDGSVAFSHHSFHRDRCDLLPNITSANKKQSGSYNDRFDEIQQQMDVMSEKLDLLISLVTANNLMSPGEAIVDTSRIPISAKRRRREGGMVNESLAKTAKEIKARVVKMDASLNRPLHPGRSQPRPQPPPWQVEEEDRNQKESQHPQVALYQNHGRMVPSDAMKERRQNLAKEPSSVARKAQQQAAEISRADELKAEVLRKGMEPSVPTPSRQSLMVVLEQRMEPAVARKVLEPDPQDTERSQVSEITLSTQQADSFNSSCSESSRKAGLCFTRLSVTEKGTKEQEALEKLRESTLEELKEVRGNAIIFQPEEEDDFKMLIDEVLGEGEESGGISDLYRQDIVQDDSTIDMVEEKVGNNTIENSTRNDTTMAAGHLMSKVTPETFQGQVQVSPSTAIVSSIRKNDEEYDAKGGGRNRHHWLLSSRLTYHTSG